MEKKETETAAAQQRLEEEKAREEAKLKQGGGGGKICQGEAARAATASNTNAQPKAIKGGEDEIMKEEEFI